RYKAADYRVRALLRTARGKVSGRVDILDGPRTVTRYRLTQSPKSTSEGEAGVHYIHNDHLGTPQVITDAEQSVVWEAVYEPFGKATVTTETIENPLRFPGQYFDEETGLHYNYFRDYNPTLSRYLSPDPIGIISHDLNLYLYVGSNPVNWVDAEGLVRKGRNARNFSRVNPRGALSLGAGGGFHYGPVGASASTSIGFDAAGRVCMQFTRCGQLGFGLFGVLGISATLGDRNFCEGDVATDGVFGEGGT
ncbi:MAG: RHS repeat-associated core domain-containing protein, partial [Gammaproteobacteria bacterium]|nr:RHS repeat-associated core domain-containing protein [Gammaproteobacteria bacterium]